MISMFGNCRIVENFESFHLVVHSWVQKCLRTVVTLHGIIFFPFGVEGAIVFPNSDFGGKVNVAVVATKPYLKIKSSILVMSQKCTF